MKTAQRTGIFFLLFLFTFFVQQVQAQDAGSGVAILVQIANENVQDGQLISATDNGYTISRLGYDPKLFGVVTDTPAVSLEDPTTPNARYVLQTGKAFVQVTTLNGEIKNGDLITSSEIPGVGQKATKNGYMLGTALEGYTNENPRETGKILVALNPGFNSQNTDVRGSLLQDFNQSLSAPFVTPLNALRYILAAFTVVVGIITGIWFFGRVSSRGVEAMGRNPLAGKLIVSSVVLNLALTLAVIGVGVFIAFLILAI